MGNDNTDCVKASEVVCQGTAMFPNLTPRKSQILRLICCGYTNREISLILGIEMNTVKNHNIKLYQLLGVNGTHYNRTYVVVTAIKYGLVKLEDIYLQLLAGGIIRGLAEHTLYLEPGAKA